MTEGWRQILEDVRNAIRGDDNAKSASKPASSQTESDGTANSPALELSPQIEAAPTSDATTLSASAASVHVNVDVEAVEAGATSAEQLPSEQVEGEPIAKSAIEATTDGQGSPVETPETPETLAKPPVTRWQRAQNIGLVVLIIGAIGFAAWQVGLGNLWSQLTAPRPPASDVVATFNGGQITTGNLEAHLRELAPDVYTETIKSPETLNALVQEMIADEVARRWAAEQKTDANTNFQHVMQHITEQMNLDTFSSQLHQGQISVPESEIQAYYETNKNTEFISQTLGTARETIRQRLVAQRENVYVRDYIARLKSNASIVRNDDLLNVPEPAEADVRAYFDANRDVYTVTARYTVDLLTAPVITSEATSKAMMERALLQVQSGADFTTAATQVSGTQVLTDFVFAVGTQGADWEATVSALQPGEMSGVLRGPRAFDVVRMVKAEPQRPMTFEEARSRVEAEVRQKRLDEWMATNGEKTLFNIKSKRYTLRQFYDEYKEFDPQTQAQYSGPGGLKRLMDVLIERLVLIEDTYDQLLQEKNKAALDQTRLDVLKQMLDQQEVDDKITLTDADLRQYYDDNRDRMALPPKARIRYIRIGLGNSQDEQNAARARADEAYRKLQPGLLQTGADFASVAKEYSEDPETAAVGGEFPDWIGEGGPLESPEFHTLHELALALPVNGVSPPTQIGDSLYIIQLIERTEPQTLTFEEAKTYIEETLRDQKHRELSLQLQDRLLKQLNFVVYDSVLQSYLQK